MNEREALLRAVCENPDDDTPRLVFADWLDEHDEHERAEFIRVQIELQTCGPGQRRLHLTRREQDLLGEFEVEWVDPVRPYLFEWSDQPWAFRRGFIERLELEAETFVEQGEELLSLTPLRDAVFPDEEWYEDLAACPLLRRLKLLDLTGSGLTSGFRGSHDFLASPHLASIQTLILQGMDDNAHLDPTGVETLSKNAHLTSLRHLDLSNNWFGPAGIPPLVNAVWLPKLERLELEGVGIQNEGVDSLAKTRRFKNLRVLNLVANSIGEQGARRILQTKWFRSLDLLDFRDHVGETHIDDPISAQTAALLSERFGDRIKL